MGKLVDADELYAAFLRDPMGGLNYDRILREEKPVDAVQVTRCKGCKYWKTAEGFNLSEKLKCCTYHIGQKYLRRDEDFCSRGEQDDDAND